MLRKLTIEGLELLDKTTIRFAPGLNVISGETGAGKSVLLSCLLATLGEDPPRQLLQNGWIESIWSGGSPPGALCEIVDETEWSLARKIDEGRAKSLCCGRSVSAGLLREAASESVLRAGQHSQQDLRRKSFHADLLDRYGEIEPPTEAWRDWQAREEELQLQKEAFLLAQEREDLLRHEVEILQELGPRPGETEELQDERSRLLHQEERSQALQDAVGFLESEDLPSAFGTLQKIASLDRSAAEAAQRLEELLEVQSEVLREVRTQLETEADPGRLEEIELRLSDIQAMQRRFRGASEEELLEKLQKKSAELEMLDSSGNLEEMAARAAEVENVWREEAKAVHKRRIQAAQSLQDAVQKELRDLAVEAQFVIEVSEGNAGPKGFSDVEFFLQRSNRKTSLSEGASGGELSRVALALLLAAGSEEEIFVFDEIDTGIGGETAHLLAAKLQELAQRRQVLVISHLPQIALRADHLLALRRSDGKTTIREANEEEPRQEELARLVGAGGSGASLEEMLREGARSS